MVDVAQAVAQLGGIATRAEVVKATCRRDLERAVRDGHLVRVARGRYALPTADAARRAAHTHTGTATLLSAAAHWGWKTKWQPRAPQIAVPRGRKVGMAQRRGVLLSWRRIAATDVVDGWVTSPVRTVLDCAALLPFDQALAVADSALRTRTVTRAQLTRAAAQLPARSRRRRVARVIECADARAANPFESVLRAIVLDVPGFEPVPQHRIERDGTFVGRVDLADLRLRIVLEAEGFEFHGEAELLEKDCKRYDELVVAGWLVLRFSWIHVMKKPAWVRDMVAGVVALRQRELAERAELAGRVA
jgi:very-short-patch-repair endonuclease